MLCNNQVQLISKHSGCLKLNSDSVFQLKLLSAHTTVNSFLLSSLFCFRTTPLCWNLELHGFHYYDKYNKKQMLGSLKTYFFPFPIRPPCRVVADIWEIEESVKKCTPVMSGFWSSSHHLSHLGIVPASWRLPLLNLYPAQQPEESCWNGDQIMSSLSSKLPMFPHHPE